MAIEGLAVGRIVHYIIGQHDGLPAAVGRHRPAIVVNDFLTDAGTVNLQVFLDCLNDTRGSHIEGQSMAWVTSRVYDDTGTVPGQWHWPERE